MFKETLELDTEKRALAFIEEVRDGCFASICEECLDLERMDLAEEEPQEVYYYTYG